MMALVVITFVSFLESQFYRLINATDKYRVTNVEYVVNPVLIRRFQKAKEKLTKARGEQMAYPVLAFHGTKEENIHSICNTGFRVPGEENFEHSTDTGKLSMVTRVCPISLKIYFKRR